MREAIGRVLGGAFSPIAVLGSLARGARLFHPDGVVYRAEVEPVAGDALATSLRGGALVRLSGALWRWPASTRRPDILGVAVRFHPDEARAQDLLFASFRTVPGLLVAPFTTEVRDFLANTYGTVLPSRATGIGRVDFRLVPEPFATTGRDRRERLESAVRAGRAAFDLEAREGNAPDRYRTIARIVLRERISTGNDDLRFDPFRAGLGIEPAGLLQALRAAVYPASQLGRALAKGPRG
jgi:hypothetical protein